MRYSRTFAAIERPIGLATAGVVLLLGLLIGCEDQLEPVRGPDRQPGLSESSTPAADSAPGCPEAPDIVLRQVPAGDALDGNGNGVVCDRNDGTPNLPVITTHDDFMAGIE